MNVTYVKDKTVIVRPTDPKNPTDPVDPTNPDGPKYPKDNDAVTNFVAGSDDETVTYTKDETVTVDPTDPKDPTNPIDPTNPDGPKYPDGVSETDLDKTISRTITYTGANKNPASVAQTATYTRTAFVDAKTGELLGYSDWTLVTRHQDW